MSVVALQARNFVQGLPMETLMDNELFETAKRQVEQDCCYSDWYWEGDLEHWRLLRLSGQIMGRVKSEKKAEASRENGRKGGRPPVTVNGVQYPIGHKRKRSSRAKVALWYHGYVKYYATVESAEKARKKLPWSDQQVAKIQELDY
jgi:hypothetical protein